VSVGPLPREDADKDKDKDLLMHPTLLHIHSCKIIGRKLARLARLCADGILTVPQFTDAVLEIEERQIHPSGVVVSATNTREDWTNVSLKVAGCAEPCVVFEFLPYAGKFRQLVS